MRRVSPRTSRRADLSEYWNEIVFQLISSMPFRHVKAHQRSASTARQGFQDMGGKRTKQNSRFDNDARPGGPDGDVQRFAIELRRCVTRVTADLGVKLSKPAAVFDPEGRAFQFPQKRPGIAIKDPTDKLKGPVPLFAMDRGLAFCVEARAGSAGYRPLAPRCAGPTGELRGRSREPHKWSRWLTTREVALRIIIMSSSINSTH